MISVDGKEHGFELMPEAECAERRMWRACVAVMVDDAIRYACGCPLDRGGEVSDGRSALEMIRDDTKDFRTACDRADVDSAMLRIRVLAEIENFKKLDKLPLQHKWFK